MEDARSNLSLRWAFMPLCLVCRIAVYLSFFRMRSYFTKRNLSLISFEIVHKEKNLLPRGVNFSIEVVLLHAKGQKHGDAYIERLNMSVKLAASCQLPFTHSIGNWQMAANFTL